MSNAYREPTDPIPWTDCNTVKFDKNAQMDIKHRPDHVLISIEYNQDDGTRHRIAITINPRDAAYVASAVARAAYEAMG
jgi:hypothetical protein